MDGFWRFLGIALGAAVLAMTVRSAHREMGAAFSLCCGAALMLLLMERLGQAVAAIDEMARLSAVSEGHMALIFKVLGISMLSEFAAQACRDAGEEGIALRVEMGGKVMLVLLSLPVLQQITQLIMELTP